MGRYRLSSEDVRRLHTKAHIDLEASVEEACLQARATYRPEDRDRILIRLSEGVSGLLKAARPGGELEASLRRQQQRIDMEGLSW